MPGEGMQMARIRPGFVAVTGAAAVAGAGYVGLVSGALPVDLGVGRRTRPLGPQVVTIAADREQVFDIVATPYLGRATHAMREKIQVLDAGSDLVLAAHRTPLYGGRLHAVTVETVGFTRPERIRFRLVRGPVPHVVEEFRFDDDTAGGTVLTYTGELGTDLWALGERWGALVARRWEQAVAASLRAILTEAQRRANR